MIDLSTLAIPPVDVVPEPTAEDWEHWSIMTINFRMGRIICSLARRCQQLETDLSNCTCGSFESLLAQAERRITELKAKVKGLQIESENYHGKCGICATANKDMLTDWYCAACEVERLRNEIKEYEQDDKEEMDWRRG